MSISILVTYATRYGSTKEVAEAVATTLRDGGLAVELRPVGEVQTLAGYDAVVLGAALYTSHWHRDALHYLTQHREALTERPVAIFALGPVHADEKERQGARAQLDKELAKYRWLAPIAIEIIGGKFDPAKLGFPWNIVPGLKKIAASDARDWTAIRAWAESLVAQLQRDLAHEPST